MTATSSTEKRADIPYVCFSESESAVNEIVRRRVLGWRAAKKCVGCFRFSLILG